MKEKEEVERLLHYQEGEIVDMKHSISELEEFVAKWKGEQRKHEAKNDVDDDFVDDEMVNDPPVEPVHDEMMNV